MFRSSLWLKYADEAPGAEEATGSHTGCLTGPRCRTDGSLSQGSGEGGGRSGGGGDAFQ